VISDKEARVLELSQGKYEASFRGTDDPNDIPFLLEQAETGGYHLLEGAVNGAGGWPSWLINQDFNDTSFANWEEIRATLRDKNFRRALSHAMDRQRIIDVAWDGFGVPQQSTISPQSKHFISEQGQQVFQAWANSYIEHNPELAKSMLDEIGMVDANGDGCRDLPSGTDFQLVFDLTDWGTEAVNTPATEVFTGNLKEVGICTIVNNVIGQPDSDLRQTQGLYMLRSTHPSELDIWTYPDWIFPVRDNRAFPLQGKWRQTGGAEGEEPTGPAKALQDIYDRGLAEPTEEGRDALVWEAVQILIDEGPFTIGASGDQAMPVVIKDNFRGVPAQVILGPWAPGSPGNLHPEQFWFDN
jgi:peptide/nickel transport system substrate-binding protein